MGLFSANEISVSASRVAIHRYFSPVANNGDHFFTNNFNELRYGNINGAYNYEGIGFYLVEDGRDGAVPLYRYYQDEVQNHFYTTNVAEIGVESQNCRSR